MFCKVILRTAVGPVDLRGLINLEGRFNSCTADQPLSGHFLESFVNVKLLLKSEHKEEAMPDINTTPDINNKTDELICRNYALALARESLDLARRTLQLGYGEKLDPELEEALQIAERFAREEN